MRRYTVALLVALATVACVREALSHCTVKHADTSNCMFEVVCYTVVKNLKLPSTPSCAGRDRIRLILKSSIAPPVHCVAFSEEVLSLRAAGNKWGRVPTSALRCMPHLQSLQLPGNLIPHITPAALSNLTALRSLDLSSNNISYIHVDAFAETPRIERLFLADNHISNIHNGTFAALSVLELLDLSHNALINLHSDVFRGLDRLKTLRLNNNKIVVLNGALKRLYGLEHLYLRENKLHRVDLQEIPTFRQLQTLDITNNTLSSIQSEMFSRLIVDMPMESSRIRVAPLLNEDNEQTVKILLSRNKIAILENASFAGEGGLDSKSRSTRENDFEITKTKATTTSVPTEIDLSFNMIDKIEFDAFQGISKLVSLDISSNRLTVFYVNTTYLNDLRRLNLKNNFLSTVDTKTFNELGKLARIDVSGNKIESLPNSDWAPRDLNILNLSNNAMGKLDISAFKVQSLSNLDVSGNRLTEVYIDNVRVSGLKTLSLRSNNISDLHLVRLSFLLELKSLDLSCNRIENVTRSPLAHVYGLRKLDLSSNIIRAVDPSAFANMPGLVTLDLSRNNMTHVDYGVFSGLEKLEELDLSHNRIGHLESRTLFDLNSLNRLNLEHNGLRAMDVDVWKGRRVAVHVYVGGNRFSCSWLANALKDAKNGWSGSWFAARLAWGERAPASTAVGGIACDDDEPAPSTDLQPARFIDERLLYTNEKILNAILMQTHELKKALKVLSYSQLKARSVREKKALQ